MHITPLRRPRMVGKRIFVILIACFSFAPFAAASRSETATTTQRASDEQSLRSARVLLATWNSRRSATFEDGFGLEQEVFIRRWFYRQAELGTLPWNMVQHDASRSLRRDGILPADLRERALPLPAELERQLPELSGSLHRVIVLGDVVLLDDDTLRIVD